MDRLPLLSLTLALPLAGGLVVALAGDAAARRLCAGVLALTLAATLAVVAAFDPAQAGFQLAESRPWIPSLNIHYRLGVDGISLLFLPLTTLLFIGITIADWRSAIAHPRLHFALLLAQLGCTLGIFLAIDTLLFFVFWEASLLPLYFLVVLSGESSGQRGGESKRSHRLGVHAAGQYVLIMLGSGALLLFAFLVAARAGADGSGWQFGLPELLAQPAPLRTQWLLFLLLFAGFAAKAPIVPLHTWLPRLAMAGPVAAMAAVLGLKLGAYGIIRFAVPLAPQVAPQLHWLLAGLGTLGILYGAVAAAAQTNLRRLLAYLGISHVGLVLVGIAAFNERGLTGAVMLVQNFTLSAGALFVFTAFLHRRTGSTDVVDLGGLAASAPRLAAIFLLLALAGIGVPGLSGFPAELAIIVAALETHTGAGLAALFGAVVGAAAFVALYRRAFYGPPGYTAPIPDLLPRELAYGLTVTALIVAAGLAPSPVLDLIAPAARQWAASLAP